MTEGPVTLYVGDCREVLRELPDESVQCCVTSPPYFGLRDYGADGQLGLEATPTEFVGALVEVFREVRRVLKKDGTLWLNLGDSYNSGASGGLGGSTLGGGQTNQAASNRSAKRRGNGLIHGLKPKDLIGIPWRVAFALQEDGWYLRQDIIWSKPNPMPESVTDRCTKAHEYIFLLTKSAKYFFDHEAIRNPPSEALLKQVSEGYRGSDTKDYETSGAQSASSTKSRIIENARKKVEKVRGHSRNHDGFSGKWDGLTKAEQQALGSNKRSVWTVATRPYKGAHFATFPPDLIRPCILAGSRPGDTVLDPFGGSGTTGQVAVEHGRESILIELNFDYVPLIERRIEA